MGILSFLLVFLQLLLLLPIDVLGTPTLSDAQVMSPTKEQMLFITENLNTFLFEKCIDLKKEISNITKIPFWPIELLEKMKECIGKMKLCELVQIFNEKIQQREQSVDQEKEQSPPIKIFGMNVKQFWEKLLQKLSEKVLSKDKKDLENLSDEQQFLLMRELFIIGEILEKQDFREKIRVYRTETRWAFAAAIFLIENKLENEYEKSNFSSFDLKQYFHVPEKFPKHDTITYISINKKQTSNFIEKMYNYLYEKCIGTTEFNKSLYKAKKLPRDRRPFTSALGEKFQKCIVQIRIDELAKVFDIKTEKQQQQEQKEEKQPSSDENEKNKKSAAEITADEFFEKILQKMLGKIAEKENVSLSHDLEKLKDEHHLMILRQLLVICEHIEDKLRGNNSAARVAKYEGVVDFGYRSEFKWKFWKAANLLVLACLSRYGKRHLYWFDLKGYFVVHFLSNECQKSENNDMDTDPSRIEMELSIGQYAIFVENMDTFLQSKCGNIEEDQIENIEEEKELNQCISQLKVAEIQSFFKEKANENEHTQKVNAYLGIILTKIMDGLQKKEKSQLSDEHNWIVLLKLFKLTYFLNKKLYHKLPCPLGDDRTYLPIYDKDFYKRNSKKCAAVEYVIRQKLEHNFKESSIEISYAYEQFQLNMPFLPYEYKMSQNNFYGVKLKVEIQTWKLVYLFEQIGLFLNKTCEKNMWSYVENEEELQKCSQKIKFIDLGNQFGERVLEKNDNIRFFVNLIVGILKAKRSENIAEKHQLNPYDLEIYSQIDKAGLEMKLSVLKGLLKFGRLFMEKFGILAMENIDLEHNRTMTWYEIPITIIQNDSDKKEEIDNELKWINEALNKAGLFEAMDEELREKRVHLLKAVGVPDEEIQEKEEFKSMNEALTKASLIEVIDEENDQNSVQLKRKAACIPDKEIQAKVIKTEEKKF